MITYPPEKLNLWNRFYNRYKTIPVEEGKENWTKIRYDLWNHPPFRYSRTFIKYHNIDRLTGSYEVFIKYLNYNTRIQYEL